MIFFFKSLSLGANNKTALVHSLSHTKLNIKNAHSFHVSLKAFNFPLKSITFFFFF